MLTTRRLRKSCSPRLDIPMGLRPTSSRIKPGTWTAAGGQVLLRRVGVDMEIRAIDSDAWITDIKKGHKFDQMAHRTGQGQLGHSMEPLRQLNPLIAGYVSKFVGD